MNELEFERVATRAAAATRAEAERIADSPRALAALLATEPAQVDGRPSVVVDFAETRSRRRTPWIPILVAAASVAVITGIVLTTRGGDDTLVVTTQPSVPDATAPIDDTIPGVVEPDTIQVPTTTAVPDTTIPLVPDAVVVVLDERGPELARTVLATYGAGDGPGDLGFESCQECEPVRPFAPVVTDDGTVFVADAFNDRWQIFRDGAWTSLPYRKGEVVTASPVMGPDGLIYASVADDLTGRTGLRIVSYDPPTMAVVDSYPGGSPAYSTVDLVNDAIEVGGQRIHTFDAPLGRPTWNVDAQASLVTLSLSGIQRAFQLPTNWATYNTEAVALDDGSIVLRVYALDGSGPLRWLLLRLWPDGTWATGTVGTNPSTTNLDGRFTNTGYVQLEDAIVEYELPGFAGIDPLAGWKVPTFGSPDLALVPRLLPQLPVPLVVSATRTEGADPAVEHPSYSQTWARADDQGAVDAFVQIGTRFEPRLPLDEAAPEQAIPLWPRSYFSDAVPPVEILGLYSASRSMTVWASGLDRAQVLGAATSLQVDDDGVGWATPSLPGPDRWTLVHEGWYSGAASRTLVRQTPDGSTYLEMSTMTGVPEAITTPWTLSSTITLRAIDGRPALLFDREGGSSAVTWSPNDGVVVVLGSYGPLDQLFEIAQSVVEVDQATWDAASTLNTSPGDGCNSMFC